MFKCPADAIARGYYQILLVFWIFSSEVETSIEVRIRNVSKNDTRKRPFKNFKLLNTSVEFPGLWIVYVFSYKKEYYEPGRVSKCPQYD